MRPGRIGVCLAAAAIAACGPADGARRPVADTWPGGARKCAGEEVLLDGRWVLDGPVTFYAEDGQRLTAQGTYREGLEDGRWTQHLADGSRAEGDYHAGRRSGLWTYWHPSGAKQEEGEYVEGERAGWWSWWYEDGSLRSRASYAGGRFEGERTDFDVEGEVIAETSGTYSGGVRVAPLPNH